MLLSLDRESWQTNWQTDRQTEWLTHWLTVWGKGNYRKCQTMLWFSRRSWSESSLCIGAGVTTVILFVCCCYTNTVSLGEHEIPTGKGTLASFADGKGTLERRLQTERGFNSLQCNAISVDVWRSERVVQQPIHSCINPTTALVDSLSIFPIGSFLG